MTTTTAVRELRRLCVDEGLDGVVLRKSANVAWAIGGRAHVAMVVDVGCLDLVVTHDEVIAVTNRIEANRLLAEELPEGIQVQAVDWQQGRDGLLPTGDRFGSDLPGAGRRDVGPAVEALRRHLDREDEQRFRGICADAAVALGSAMRSLAADDREVDVAGKVAAALWHADLEPVVLLVAGERRAPAMRHPLPTTDVVGDRAVVSICARRKGLIASATRIAVFGGDASAYERLVEVEGAMLDATVVGAPFSAPIEAARLAYPENGFPADEWTRHHQGGPTGFLPRDWPATTASAVAIAAGQPVAWNPTAAGLKVEDTWLVTGSGLELLTVDGTWPTITVRGRRRPGLLMA
jgi:antitoxin VapB